MGLLLSAFTTHVVTQACCCIRHGRCLVWVGWVSGRIGGCYLRSRHSVTLGRLVCTQTGAKSSCRQPDVDEVSTAHRTT
jgi:hypothetical protein